MREQVKNQKAINRSDIHMGVYEKVVGNDKSNLHL